MYDVSRARPGQMNGSRHLGRSCCIFALTTRPQDHLGAASEMCWHLSSPRYLPSLWRPDLGRHRRAEHNRSGRIRRAMLTKARRSSWMIGPPAAAGRRYDPRTFVRGSSACGRQIHESSLSPLGHFPGDCVRRRDDGGQHRVRRNWRRHPRRVCARLTRIAGCHLPFVSALHMVCQLRLPIPMSRNRRPRSCWPNPGLA
jgi:hypothetical protein